MADYSEGRGMLRRYIAKGTKIEAYSDEYIQTAQDWLNTYPRKLFDYQTSAEMFQAELLKSVSKKLFKFFLQFT